MEHWEIAKKEAEEQKELQKKFPFLNKRVRRMGVKKWEEGIVVLSKFDDEDEDEQFIKFGEDDLEQLYGLPFEVWNEEKEIWEEG